jgi:hypothetical protein
MAVVLAAGFALLAAAGCGDSDDDEEEEPTPVAGTYVGKVRGTSAFVSVVASPAVRGQDRREVTVFLCDARRVCEWFTGSSSGNRFRAASERDAEVSGELSEVAVAGRVELPDGEGVRYRAERAAAASGQYDLTVSSDGELSGASAAGVALQGETTLPGPGRGTLRLADGTRLRFRVTRSSGRPELALRAGQVRLIVLPGGELRGAGRTRRSEDRRVTNFFIRSSG